LAEIADRTLHVRDGMIESDDTKWIKPRPAMQRGTR
jgi:hypothetical protein